MASRSATASTDCGLAAEAAEGAAVLERIPDTEDPSLPTFPRPPGGPVRMFGQPLKALPLTKNKFDSNIKARSR